MMRFECKSAACSVVGKGATRASTWAGHCAQGSSFTESEKKEGNTKSSPSEGQDDKV